MSQQSLPFDEPAINQTILPVYSNLVEASVDKLLEQLTDQLPDLSNVHILLSSNSGVSTFRSTLLAKASSRGYPALLGPHILSVDNWAKQYARLPQTILSEHARELLLVGALQEFPEIYKHSNPWVLAESLMDLFDELTLAHLELPHDIETFKKQVSDAYGATEQVNATLGKEALLVHTLWYAMHEQLSDLNRVDNISANLMNLGSSCEQLPDTFKIYYCGIDNPNPSEKKWQQTLTKRGQLSLVLHNYHQVNAPDNEDSYFQFLSHVYDTRKDNFYGRTDAFRRQYPKSPANSRIRIFSAESSEDEALGIDIQIRRWLLAGKRNIGIVTENRKLARRVRALLERANINIDDEAGWALSTTSAATALERWLETIEQDFHYLPLLDFLKSPFVLSTDEEFSKTIYQFEQHIVIDGNIPSDINRYLHHIELRKTALQEENIHVNYDGITELLHSVYKAAGTLIKLKNSDKEHNAGDFISALLESLAELKIVDAFKDDAAGIQLLSEINKLDQAAKLIPTSMNWVAFRSWLGRTLERFNFKPEPQSSPVKITTLAHSEYFKFDACVIAGAERNFLPHNGKVSPFFNDAVRTALNITTQAECLALNYFLFRRLLCSVDHDESESADILITRRAVENGEEIIASPWVAALQAFHKQCYGSDLTDIELTAMVADPACQVVLDHSPLPMPVKENPRTRIPTSLLPHTLSASAYQQLINCPYQFFAARCLSLAPPETVKEALRKLDYGNHVHRCLEAFHSNLKNYPGPFKEKITNANKDDAIALLNEISLAVFSNDIEDNFQHRGWLKRWQATIPLYIEWQMKQQEQYTPVDLEIEINKTTLTENIAVKGRIDRIDGNENGIAVMDYKTGYMPKAEDILSGEATQLPFYLLLLMTENDPRFSNYLTPDNDQLTAFYVDLYKRDKVTIQSAIKNPELLEIVDKNRHRLIEVMEQLQQGYEAPAWGNVDVCKYCDMDVLCRKQVWTSDSETI